MTAAGWAAVIVSAVLVAALAFFLIWIVFILRRIVDTLGKVLFGAGAIAYRLVPVGPVLGDINGDLAAVVGALESLVDDLTPAKTEAAS